MRKTNLNKEQCPLARALDIVGEWWSLLILREAFSGARRFEEFQENLGIPRNTLTQRLSKLVKMGVLDKRPVGEGARRHEYILSPKGLELLPAIVALREWGQKYFFKPNEASILLVDNRDGSKVYLKTQLLSKGEKLVPLNELRLVSSTEKTKSKT